MKSRICGPIVGTANFKDNIDHLIRPGIPSSYEQLQIPLMISSPFRIIVAKVVGSLSVSEHIGISIVNYLAQNSEIGLYFEHKVQYHCSRYPFGFCSLVKPFTYTTQI